MNWQEVCEHPSLKDLPFKIELHESHRHLRPAEPCQKQVAFPLPTMPFPRVPFKRFRRGHDC